MRRRLFNLAFNLAAAVSLVLCVATAALWVRSYYRGDALYRHLLRPDLRITFETSASSFRGRIEIARNLYPVAGDVDAYRGYVGTWVHSTFLRGTPRPRPGLLDRIGFRWEVGGNSQRKRAASNEQRPWGWRIGFPHWLLVGLFALPPMLVATRFLRPRRRARRGLCATCGYDLRATPERCPECGTAASSDLGMKGTL